MYVWIRLIDQVTNTDIPWLCMKFDYRKAVQYLIHPSQFDRNNVSYQDTHQIETCGALRYLFQEHDTACQRQLHLE